MLTVENLREQIQRAYNANLLEEIRFGSRTITFKVVDNLYITNQQFWFNDHKKIEKALKLERHIRVNFPDVTKITHFIDKFGKIYFELEHTPHYTEL